MFSVAALWLGTAAQAQETAALPVESTDPPPAPIDAVRAELEAQRLEIAAAQAKLAEQQAALEAMQAQITETRLKLIPPDEFKLTFEGHYRVRGHVFNHLFESQTGPGGSYQDARYLSQRLWLRPKFDYKGLAKLFIEFRALEDVVFGDNAALATTALFAGDPSFTDIEGQEVLPVTIGRAWMEFSLPVGLMRVGRIPSQWGMGLLVGPGDGFDQPFGESYYPSTNDRILFATKPIAIFDAITGREDRGIPFFLAVAVDRLVEDPLIQYYGFQCSPGDTQGDPGFDPRCDSDDDGVTDLDHGYQDDTVVASGRGPDWWADQNDDVMQMVYVATYRGEGIRYLGGVGDLTGGAWVVNRTQRETDSNIWILDGAMKASVHSLLLESEFIAITGETRALPLPDSTLEDPLQKNASIAGYAVKGGYVRKGWKVLTETGFASGDDNVADETFTGRALHPDHNVGLLLYEEVLARTTAGIRTTGARGLWSNGGVYSSRYVFPTVHVMPLDNWEILGGFVAAWPNRPDGAVIRCNDGDKVDCATPTPLQATSDMLGWEVDFGVHHVWHRHLMLAVETGYAKATDRLPLETAGLNPKGNFFTLQSRIAWQF